MGDLNFTWQSCEEPGSSITLFLDYRERKWTTYELIQFHVYSKGKQWKRFRYPVLSPRFPDRYLRIPRIYARSRTSEPYLQFQLAKIFIDTSVVDAATVAGDYVGTCT